MAKETLKLVIIGHVDHGKSTLIGRLILDTGSFPLGKIKELKKISRELGKDTEIAFLLDQLKEEREQSRTIDTTQVFLKTSKRNYVVIDTPGHAEFIKNMITGASCAQAAILIIDINEGMMEQTKRHAYLISMLGIKKVIVALNKIDLVNYDEVKFNALKSEIAAFLSRVNIFPVAIIPISAKEGVNIYKKDKKIKWYPGPSLISCLDGLKLNPRVKNMPLRFPVQDLYDKDCAKMIVGRLESGLLKKGQQVVVLPQNKKTKISSINVFGSCGKKAAYTGENIGLVLDNSSGVKRGDVIVAQNCAPMPSKSFKGNVFWMSDQPFLLNKKMILRCATQEVGCIGESIEKKINSVTLDIIDKDPKELRFNEAGSVVFKTDVPVVVEDFTFIEALGRFTIENGQEVQGAGIITEKMP